ncbi:MAG: D-cysteine desulfhydrase family protein [Anaerolineales bacterium]|nr:D-cysteine desulfhydrase family protein [Anaerolineales bacterium]
MYTLPRLRFAHLPTPVETMPRLSEFLGGPQLWVKRDDLTGLAFGGNKTRKLEFLLAEAQAHGARTLITAGAVQSNHCRQTAAAAARYGLDCILVLTGEPPEQNSGNFLLDQLLGADIVWSPPADRDRKLEEVFNTAWQGGMRPYLIPYGGSNAVGASAYAFAMEELLSQGMRPDWVVFPSSSGGTQAGLVVGGKQYAFSGKILGISVDKPKEGLADTVLRLALSVGECLKAKLDIREQDVLVNDDFLGAGYGVMGPVEREALQLFARTEGLLLDPVYTGKAGAGLISLVRSGYFRKDDVVLFWHTGGTPALFAEAYTRLI